MTRNKQIQIAIVEDDKYFNKMLTKYIHTVCGKHFFPEVDLTVDSYLSGHDFVEKFNPQTDILLLDYYLFNSQELDQLNGEDILKIVRRHSPNCKVILLSALTDPFKIDRLESHGLIARVDKNVSSKNRVGAILQETIAKYYLYAS